jgi:hypothetical protein
MYGFDSYDYDCKKFAEYFSCHNDECPYQYIDEIRKEQEAEGIEETDQEILGGLEESGICCDYKEYQRWKQEEKEYQRSIYPAKREALKFFRRLLKPIIPNKVINVLRKGVGYDEARLKDYATYDLKRIDINCKRCKKFVKCKPFSRITEETEFIHDEPDCVYFAAARAFGA